MSRRKRSPEIGVVGSVGPASDVYTYRPGGHLQQRLIAMAFDPNGVQLAVKYTEQRKEGPEWGASLHIPPGGVVHVFELLVRDPANIFGPFHTANLNGAQPNRINATLFRLPGTEYRSPAAESSGPSGSVPPPSGAEPGFMPPRPHVEPGVEPPAPLVEPTISRNQGTSVHDFVRSRSDWSRTEQTAVLNLAATFERLSALVPVGPGLCDTA